MCCGIIHWGWDEGHKAKAAYFQGDYLEAGYYVNIGLATPFEARKTHRFLNKYGEKWLQRSLRSLDDHPGISLAFIQDLQRWQPILDELNKQGFDWEVLRQLEQKVNQTLAESVPKYSDRQFRRAQDLQADGQWLLSYRALRAIQLVNPNFAGLSELMASTDQRLRRRLVLKPLTSYPFINDGLDIRKDVIEGIPIQQRVWEEMATHWMGLSIEFISPVIDSEESVNDQSSDLEAFLTIRVQADDQRDVPEEDEVHDYGQINPWDDQPLEPLTTYRRWKRTYGVSLSVKISLWSNDSEWDEVTCQAEDMDFEQEVVVEGPVQPGYDRQLEYSTPPINAEDLVNRVIYSVVDRCLIQVSDRLNPSIIYE